MQLGEPHNAILRTLLTISRLATVSYSHKQHEHENYPTSFLSNALQYGTAYSIWTLAAKLLKLTIKIF